jgi:hypothetical protein
MSIASLKFLPNSTFKITSPLHSIEEVMQNVCMDWYKAGFFYFVKNKLYVGHKSPLNFSLTPGNALEFYTVCQAWRGRECSTERRDLGLWRCTCTWVEVTTSLFIVSHLLLYRSNRKTATRSSTRRFVLSLGRKAALNFHVFFCCIPQEISY